MITETAACHFRQQSIFLPNSPFLIVISIHISWLLHILPITTVTTLKTPKLNNNSIMFGCVDISTSGDHYVLHNNYSQLNFFVAITNHTK